MSPAAETTSYSITIGGGGLVSLTSSSILKIDASATITGGALALSAPLIIIEGAVSVAEIGAGFAPPAAGPAAVIAHTFINEHGTLTTTNALTIGAAVTLASGGTFTPPPTDPLDNEGGPTLLINGNAEARYGSSIRIDDFSTGDVNGTLDIQYGSTFTIENSSTLDISGAVTLGGSMTVAASTVTISNSLTMQGGSSSQHATLQASGFSQVTVTGSLIAHVPSTITVISSRLEVGGAFDMYEEVLNPNVLSMDDRTYGRISVGTYFDMPPTTTVQIWTEPFTVGGDVYQRGGSVELRGGTSVGGTYTKSAGTFAEGFDGIVNYGGFSETGGSSRFIWTDLQVASNLALGGTSSWFDNSRAVVSGQITLNAGTVRAWGDTTAFWAPGGMQISSGAVFDVIYADVYANVTNSGTITLGDVNSEELNIGGAFTQTSTGHLVLRLGPVTASLFSCQIANFGGALEVILDPGYTGAYVLGTYQTRNSGFDSVSLGEVWYDDTAGEFGISLD